MSNSSTEKVERKNSREIENR